MKLFDAIFRFFVARLSDKEVEKKYIRAGARFGNAVSYIYMGECVRFARMLRRWARWEKEYTRRGYRALSLDAFVDYGGYGISLVGLRTKRGATEAAVLHAEIYRERFLGKIKPVITPKEMLEGPTSATYVLPSTKN